MLKAITLGGKGRIDLVIGNSFSKTVLNMLETALAELVSNIYPDSAKSCISPLQLDA